MRFLILRTLLNTKIISWFTFSNCFLKLYEHIQKYCSLLKLNPNIKYSHSNYFTFLILKHKSHVGKTLKYILCISLKNKATVLGNFKQIKEMK